MCRKRPNQSCPGRAMSPVSRNRIEAIQLGGAVRWKRRRKVETGWW